MRRSIAAACLAFVLGCGSEAPPSDSASPEVEVEAEAAPAVEAAPVPEPEPEPEPELEAEPTGGISLHAAPHLVEALIALEGPVVPEAELPALFARLARDSEALCRHMQFGDRLPDEDIEHYITPPGSYRSAPLRTRRSMIAGCWNFVRMNDRSPDRDLALVSSLYDAPSYDCVSVGVMQPYLMTHLLGCAHLTMLDFDWQIHRVHTQLLAAMRERALNEDNLDEQLGNMRVDWIAHFKDTVDVPLSLRSLCRGDIAGVCAAALFGAQAALPELEGVTLALAGLHDAPFEALPEGRVRVLYLSNALERAYTTGEEFTGLMTRLAEATKQGQTAVLIHHAGGQPSFGIYELSRTSGEGEALAWELRTRCRDPYLMSVAREGTDGVYKTWLEGVSVNTPHAPTCTDLAAERGLP